MNIDSYFQGISDAIRSQPISWDAHRRAGSLSAENVQKIKQYTLQSKEERCEAIQKDGLGYARLIFSLLGGSRRTDVIQYGLIMLDDLLEDFPGFANNIIVLQQEDIKLPFQPLIR